MKRQHRHLAYCLEELEQRCMLSLASAATIAAGDFDGDGYDDLVIGKPYETVAYDSGAGLVEVRFGNSGGVSAREKQVLHQDFPGIKGTADPGDNFGFALAVGDFNRDGYDDLAVGSPHEDLDGKNAAGTVEVIYGYSGGLTTVDDQFWHQDSTNVNGVVEADDKFGFSLASGDFNGDGYDDLAIGAPEEDLTISGTTVEDAGQVNVLYGRSSGLSGSGDQHWYQGRDGVWGARERFDKFGKVLATGDFDNDGYDDLAVGVPLESINSKEDAGAVQLIFGSSSKLTGVGDQRWHQDVSSIIGQAEADDRYGGALAVGDFNKDGYDDLAIGVWNEDVNSGGTNVEDAGLVSVLKGSANGLTGTGDKVFWQGRKGLWGTREKFDRFGRRLAAGDFDKDGYDDLAVGVPQENWNDLTDSGVTQVIYGASSGLSESGDQVWHQDSAGIWSSDEARDRFGSALVVADFDRDGYDDLAVEVERESFSAASNHGAINVLFGKSSGIGNAGDQARWSNIFKIDIVFQDSNLSNSQQKIVYAAAARWSEVIRGDLPSYTVSGKGTVDDLVVEISTESIDGTSGTLASAGPRLRRSGTFLPAVSEMTIDSADKGRSDLFTIVLHEFGHAIGFHGGTLDKMGLRDDTNHRFLGTNATQEYNNMFNINATSVPMHTKGGHWSETVFDDELMTPYADDPAPLSRLTIAALKDMGYVVSFTYADPF